MILKLFLFFPYYMQYHCDFPVCLCVCVSEFVQVFLNNRFLVEMPEQVVHAVLSNYCPISLQKLLGLTLHFN